ncbi:hypothetical protein [Longispora albida]|uniref:hypothetical protein n=1 Tax=Longispora albida TaxID=203523 RepID=UPI000360D59D|nr:hypothetical protein [Longispora albida]
MSTVEYLRYRPYPARRLLTVAGVPGAVLLGVLVAWQPLLLLGACVAGLCAAVIWVRPAVAAYGLIGLTPILGGIERDAIIPVLRPSEAILLLAGATLAARGFLRWDGTLRWPRLSRVELGVVLMAIASSVLPLTWMAVQSRPIDTDDVLHALVLWKFLGLYVIVRVAVKTGEQVRRALWVSMGTAALVALIAIPQAVGLFGVPEKMDRISLALGNSEAAQHRTGQGASTLGLPGAVADLMVLNLGVAWGLLVRAGDGRYRMILAALGLLFAVGAASSGEFSSTLGLLIGIAGLAVVTSRPKLIGAAVLGGLAAYPLLRPVIERRLSGFQSASGIPESWVGRLNNLRTHFWPELFSNWNFVLGVRPSARVPVRGEITGYAWIESGHTWLLWGGGIPLLAAFLYFSAAVFGAAWRSARATLAGPRGAAATAVFAAMLSLTVLMAFDPHLTYRGSADAFFGMLALAGLGFARTGHTTTTARGGA